MPLLANVNITTSRSTYADPTVANTSGVTSAPTAYLQSTPAHIQPMNMAKYAMFGDAALSSDYVVNVDTGTDIIEGDRVSSIVLILDGVTPWPGSIPANAAANEFWIVTKAVEVAPLLLPARLAFIKRVKGGGPGTA